MFPDDFKKHFSLGTRNRLILPSFFLDPMASLENPAYVVSPTESSSSVSLSYSLFLLCFNLNPSVLGLAGVSD